MIDVRLFAKGSFHRENCLKNARCLWGTLPGSNHLLRMVSWDLNTMRFGGDWRTPPPWLVSPPSRVVRLPNGLNVLWIGVINHLLTGMILQVDGFSGSFPKTSGIRIKWGTDNLLVFEGHNGEFVWFCYALQIFKEFWNPFLPFVLFSAIFSVPPSAFDWY